jgi:hypothetical protein
MCFDSGLGDKKRTSDLFVGCALSQEADNIALSLGEG